MHGAMSALGRKEPVVAVRFRLKAATWAQDPCYLLAANNGISVK